jgi:hypothetical protein
MSDDEAESTRLNVVPFFRAMRPNTNSGEEAFEGSEMPESAVRRSMPPMRVGCRAATELSLPTPDKAKEKTRQQNREALSILTQALKGKSMENAISKSCTKDWTWFGLEDQKTRDDRFIPDGVDRSVNLTNELAAVSMGKKAHTGN